LGGTCGEAKNVAATSQVSRAGEISEEVYLIVRGKRTTDWKKDLTHEDNPGWGVKGFQRGEVIGWRRGLRGSVGRQLWWGGTLQGEVLVVFYLRGVRAFIGDNMRFDVSSWFAEMCVVDPVRSRRGEDRGEDENILFSGWNVE